MPEDELQLIAWRAASLGQGERAETLVRLLMRCRVEIIKPEIGPCWLWTGPTSGDGRGGFYGRISYQGRTVAVHRLSFALCKGPLVAGKQVDHVCNQRLCFHPNHLVQMTHLRNQRLRVKRSCK